MALLYSFIYFKLDMNQEGVQNINGVLFLCILNTTFGSLFSVIQVNYFIIINSRKLISIFEKSFSKRHFQKKYHCLFERLRMACTKLFHIIWQNFLSKYTIFLFVYVLF